MILVLLAQVATPEVEKIAEVAAKSTGWTPEMVTAVFAGLVGVITALTTLIIQIRNLKRDISPKMEEVHHAVNVTDMQRLNRINELTTRVADLTGDPADVAASDAADRVLQERKKLTEEKG